MVGLRSGGTRLVVRFAGTEVDGLRPAGVRLAVRSWRIVVPVRIVGRLTILVRIGSLAGVR